RHTRFSRDWSSDVCSSDLAYLTKEIGLTAPGGPRLWDLKGLDYYWGILHPVVMLVLFFTTGSIDIILPRLLSLVCGAAVVVLIRSEERRVGREGGERWGWG